MPSLPPPPSFSDDLQIYFSQQNIRVIENAGEVLITIIRSGPVSPVTVRIQTADGSATGGSDYRRTRGPVTFEEGDIEITIAIRIIDDDLYEPDESFTVALFNPSSGTIPFGLNIVTIVIEDDDGDVGFRRSGDVLVPPNPRPQPKSIPGLPCPGPTCVPNPRPPQKPTPGSPCPGSTCVPNPRPPPKPMPGSPCSGLTCALNPRPPPIPSPGLPCSGPTCVPNPRPPQKPTPGLPCPGPTCVPNPRPPPRPTPGLPCTGPTCGPFLIMSKILSIL